jgi:hypothetical protein
VKTVSEDHREYMKACFGGRWGHCLNSGQQRELRRAFFAGAHSAFRLMTGYITGLPDDKAEAELQRFLDECEQFKKDVLAGRK